MASGAPFEAIRYVSSVLPFCVSGVSHILVLANNSFVIGYSFLRCQSFNEK